MLEKLCSKYNYRWVRSTYYCSTVSKSYALNQLLTYFTEEKCCASKHCCWLKCFSDLEVSVALLFCSYSPSSTPQRPHYFHPHSFAAFLWLFMAFSAITYSPNTVALNLAVFESWIVQMVTLSYWVDKKNIKSTHALSNKSSILNAKENRFSPGKMVSWLSTASIFHFPTEKWPRTAKTVQNQCRKWRQPAIIVIFQ